MRLISELDRVCLAKANEAGQGHVFDGWEDLSPAEQQGLLAQVEGIDFQLFRRLLEQHIHTVAGPMEKRVFRPAPLTELPSPLHQREEYEFCRGLAEYAIRNQELLVVTAAGGGGAFPEPIGMLPVGPVTSKSTFQLMAERILAIHKRYRKSLSWNIFCHPEELDKVRAFFKAHSYFGLVSGQVTLVPQPVLPVVDRRGRILLSGPGRIAMSPSGHGTILLHFLDEERLNSLAEAGIRHVLYHQVDNPLARVVDLTFLGLHIKNGSEISSKAVLKSSPDESVGVFCQFNDTTGVVEYMELGPEEREARQPDGSLAFCAANIGTHIVSVEFLRRMRTEGLQLPFHAIERITPCLDRKRRWVEPTESNSIGFRAFVFDAIPFAKRTMVTGVRREEEFSPIKCPTGACSPETAKKDLSRLYARWLAEAGRPVPGAEDPTNPRPVEISPLFALEATDLPSRAIPAFPAEGGVLLGDRP